MFKAMRMNMPEFSNQTIKKWLGSLGGFLLMITAIVFLTVKDQYTAQAIAPTFIALCLWLWFVALLYFIHGKWWGGYLLEQDRLIFNFRFLRHELLYQDIKGIIISNWQGPGRYGGIERRPWITVMGKQKDDILTRYMRHKGKRVLMHSDIDLEHDASHYGFSWNKKEMYKLLENYQGSYYIAASVISRNDKEFKDICQQYGIENERIHIIDDSRDGEFVWKIFEADKNKSPF